MTISMGSRPFKTAGTDTLVSLNSSLKSFFTCAGNCGADSKSLDDSSLMSSKSFSASRRSLRGKESSRAIRECSLAY